MPELHAVDPRQRNVDALTGEQAVAEHHPPVGDDEVCRQPVEERPHGQPADDQQPHGQDHQQHDRLGGAPVLLVDDRGNERRDGRADDQQQHRPDEPLPVRVAVQHHPFVGGQHVIRVTHDGKLYGLTGRKCVISPADTVNTSSPVSMRSLPRSSTSAATPSTVRSPGRLARTRLPIVTLRDR